MGVDFNAVLFFGVKCDRSQLYATEVKPGCKHKVSEQQAFCPTCGARAKVEHEYPHEGYSEDDNVLTTKNHEFEVFNPDGMSGSDVRFVGMKLAATSWQETMIGINMRHGLDQLPPVAMEELIKIGVADEIADFKLWVILEVS